MRRIEVYEVDGENKVAAIALTLLRVGVGSLLMIHGWQKLNDISGTAASFAALGVPSPRLAVYLGILGELFGGLGLALGALTPLAAFGPVLTMSFAIYFAHRDNGPLLKNGGWEYAFTILLVALYFVAHGPGPLSVDALVASARRRGIRRRQHGTVATRP